LPGSGNLYADEILFRARMHPATEVARSSDKDLIALFRAITLGTIHGAWAEAIAVENRISIVCPKNHGCLRIAKTRNVVRAAVAH